MIMRNTLKPAEQERHAACHDGYLKVFNHHVYEIRKGLRDLVLQTLPSKHAPWITRKLENLDIAYLIISAGQRNINVFFGHSHCLEIVQQLGLYDLSQITPEEDFILGILLGYGRQQQCRRYLYLKRQGHPQPHVSMEAPDDFNGLPNS